MMIRRLLSSSASSPFIKVTEHASAGVIQLNRPEVLNAMSIDMLNKLVYLLSHFEQRKEVVVFKGLPNVFCVGADVKDLMASPPSEIPYNQAEKTLLLTANYKKPYVALIHGTAMGAAGMFSLGAKYRVVTEATTFCMPENAIGYFTDNAAGYFLSRLERNLGYYMALTGAKITGCDMVKSKLATHFVQSFKLDDLEKNLVQCKDHDDVSEVLNFFSEPPQPSETQIDLLLPQIEKCFGSATVEEIYENLERDASDWSKKTIKTLNRMSPTSLKVSHRFLKIGRKLSMREILLIETALVQYYMGNKVTLGAKEMVEGVRAMLVDKDYQPKWNLTLAEVSEERIDEIFQLAMNESNPSQRSHL